MLLVLVCLIFLRLPLQAEAIFFVLMSLLFTLLITLFTAGVPSLTVSGHRRRISAFIEMKEHAFSHKSRSLGGTENGILALFETIESKRIAWIVYHFFRSIQAHFISIISLILFVSTICWFFDTRVSLPLLVTVGTWIALSRPRLHGKKQVRVSRQARCLRVFLSPGVAAICALFWFSIAVSFLGSASNGWAYLVLTFAAIWWSLVASSQECDRDLLSGILQRERSVDRSIPNTITFLELFFEFSPIFLLLGYGSLIGDFIHAAHKGIQPIDPLIPAAALIAISMLRFVYLIRTLRSGDLAY
jgi:hypothetical protein